MAQTPGAMLEVDPATFALKGYSLHVRVPLNGSEEARRWTVGVGGYAMEFPSAMRGMAVKNAASSTEIEIERGAAVFIDRYLDQPLQGWFTGLELGRQRYKLSDGAQVERYDATVAMPRLGYHFKLDGGWYVLPWVGVGFVDTDRDELNVGGRTVKPRSTLAFATVHVGYAF
ncbi:hypothetical protein [Ideonella livida]|uniref:Outer membrane protein beta-barrel domain-containing protein n=1 Tax=Ideonella livida TaxID=2707176 RepID=A0A7C9PHX7_9BURK|nr:hypothetical protein [Ideonella livida]NDY92229.1 hypothetical protein [Ideonella livida]